MKLHMNRRAFREFHASWQEYETMVSRILPRFIMRGLYDLSDDIEHMLFCRDEIERVFLAAPDDARLVPYRLRLLSLDADLLLMRAEVLARHSAQACKSWRKRNKVPRSHWWWYLDEVDQGLIHAPANGAAASRAQNGEELKLR